MNYVNEKGWKITTERLSKNIVVTDLRKDRFQRLCSLVWLKIIAPDGSETLLEHTIGNDSDYETLELIK